MNLNERQNEQRINVIKMAYPRIKVMTSLDDLLPVVAPGDTVVFDSVLDLSYGDEFSIEKAIKNYKKLLSLDVEITCDRSPSCDSVIMLEEVDELAEKGVSFKNPDQALSVLLELQIKAYINFKEADSRNRKLSQFSAKKNYGSQIGRKIGTRIETERAKHAKQMILKYSKAFGGTMLDNDLMKEIGISRNQYYIYKKELKNSKHEKGDNEDAEI